VRPWGNQGDRKNDGYLPSKRTLFQSYAPNELTAAECVQKIDDDFEGALPYWKKYFDIWVFVHNSRPGLPPHAVERLLKLTADHAPLKATHWGFEELYQEAFKLSEEQLTSLLGNAPSQAAMVKLAVADLEPVLDQIAKLPATPDPDLRPVPPDKLAYNLLSDSVATLLKAGMSRADLVRRYFHGQPNQMRRDEIAEAFKAKYAELRAQKVAPDEIFVQLQVFAAGGVHPNPSRQCAVLAVLSFLFEECDIFERPPEGAETKAAS
jgi:hypothetical protein